MRSTADLSSLIGKASVLLEAMPYLQAFRGKIFVIKTGGVPLQEPQERRKLLQDFLFLSLAGIQPVLVHGGGADISKQLKGEGMTPRFVEGLRVTDRATLSVVVKTLKELNNALVKELRSLGGEALGLSGATDKVLQAERLSLRGQDLGFVGKIRRVNTGPVLSAFRRNKIPVLTPLGDGGRGQLLNVNADQAAAALAGALRAEKFVLVTDVKGIFREPGKPSSLIPTCSVSQVERLIAQGVIHAGMIPKTRACTEALARGVGKTHMIDFRIPHGLLLEIFTDRGIGTEIIR